MTDVQRPIAIAVGPDVWIGAASSSSRIDPASGEVTAIAPTGVGGNGSIARGENEVFVRSRDRFVVRVDATDGTVIEGYAAEGLTSAGDIIVAFGSVWTDAYDDATLFRLSID